MSSGSLVSHDRPDEVMRSLPLFITHVLLSVINSFFLLLAPSPRSLAFLILLFPPGLRPPPSAHPFYSFLLLTLKRYLKHSCLKRFSSIYFLTNLRPSTSQRRATIGVELRPPPPTDLPVRMYESFPHLDSDRLT